jgi:transcriptional regulator with PAS, ATPase and Fis domain
MAVRMIENRLIAATCQRQIRLHLHTRLEGLGTVGEGIVVLSHDAWVMGGNRAGLMLLKLSATDLGSAQLKTMLDTSLDELLSRHKRRPGQATQVRLFDGTTLFAMVQLDAINLPGSSVSVPVLGSTSAGLPPARDALAHLDTGDLRWRTAADKVRRIVDKPIPLLIQGESGVGKELFARAAHDSGPRRKQPFVAINCAAVPENLIEAELFGYASGAFTGARKEGSQGRLREAHGGTLFLDEIGDMPLAMQARLLRVLQERQVSPLGGGASVAVDFSLICATHCKLREAAELGRFRSDLYYRINGLTVILPPLRERTDFDVLTQRLLADLCPQRSVRVEPELLLRLSRHAWPGNLRQYANVLRTACAMLDAADDCITWAHLSDDVQEDLSAPTAQPLAPTACAVASTTHAQNLQQLSQVAIRQAIEMSYGNVSQAAKRLGISRQTLYRKLGDALH